MPGPDMASQAEGPASRREDRGHDFVPSPAIIRRGSSPTFTNFSFPPHSHHSRSFLNKSHSLRLHHTCIHFQS